MVVESLQQNLYLVTVIFATLTALLGMVVINVFFRDRFRELFSDKTYFMFFFMIFGYALFALGELSWYLFFQVTGEEPALSMPDLYWTMGSLFLLAAFVALAVVIGKAQGEARHLFLQLGIGAVLLLFVVVYNSSLDRSQLQESGGHAFFGYFYTIISVLIVTASLAVPLAYQHAGFFRQELLLLFGSNVGFLLGDLLYVTSAAQGFSETLGVASELIYILAYALSALACFFFLLKAHRQSSSPGRVSVL